MKPLLPLLVSATLLSQCKKDDPESQLPPATQIGANTFGCLVNGQAWTPRGNNSYANYSVVYDAGYSDGTLSVSAYRLSGNGADQQDIGVNSDSLRHIGTYQLRTSGRHGAAFVDLSTKCKYYSQDKTTYCRGTLTITRLDLTAGIVSGIFAFTLYKPGCDSIRVTYGRFDKRL